MQYTCCYGPKHVLAAIMTFTSHNDRFWNVFLFAFDGFAIIGPEFLPNQQVHQHRLQNTEFIAINTQHLGPFVNANLQTKDKMCAEVNNGKQNASMTMPSRKSHSIRKLYTIIIIGSEISGLHFITYAIVNIFLDANTPEESLCCTTVRIGRFISIFITYFQKHFKFLQFNMVSQCMTSVVERCVNNAMFFLFRLENVIEHLKTLLSRRCHATLLDDEHIQSGKNG